jgi:hypothetical protein
MKPLAFHPEALGELHVAPVYHYDTGYPEVGDALVDELNHALNEIAEHPHRWKRILQDIHAYGPTKRFKWRVVYVERAEDVFILAAYYSGVEDPLFWIERLSS